MSVFGAILALALPGVAQAHHDPPVDFQGATAATTPTIDGVIGAGEWTDATPYDVTIAGLPGTVRFKHDANFLYVAMTMTDDSGGSKEMGVFFDDNHDGIKDPGEDVMLGFAAPISFGADYYYSSTGSSGATHYADTSTDGTNPPGDGTDDIVGAGKVVGSDVTFELRHPLCSDDTAHDFCLTPGDTVGLDLMYVINQTGFMYPGADAFVPSDWADLTLSAAPPPAGRIVFESNRDGNLEIYRMNADGSAPTRLTNDPATDNTPSISPDGRKVAFSSDREGSADIYVMNIDGSGLTRLTSDPGLEQQPAWSPDGTKIAYQGSSIEQYDIFVVDATGGTPVDVTSTSANEASASWSPDGTQLVFMSDRDGNEEVYRQNADGTGTATRLTNNPARDADPDWSPDGQKIAFFSDRPGSSCCGTVWTINASDGSGATNLTNGSIFDADPSWSPDGTRIAFVRDAGGQNFEVWTALADGTGQVDLTPIGGRNSFPDWGPTPSNLTASISIAAPESSDPGAASAAIAGIPLDAIRGESQTTAGAPLGGIPLGGIPLGGIPLGGIPLGGIPLGGIGFTAQNLSQNGLGGIPLSTIPLVLPDTWEAHLALDPAFKGTPPQNVTLAQVLGTAVVSGVTLDKLNLASSPLGGIPLAGIALGGLPLGGIPLGGIAGTPSDQNLSDWCDYVNQQPGFTCSGGPSLNGQTMLGLALQGVPLGGIPLGGIPLGGIPLGGIPLGGIAVGTPLGGIPLGGINLVGTPLGGIPLGGIDMSASPLGGITLGSIPASAKLAIFECPIGNFVCADTDTLAQAKAAGAIKQTAQLQDLGYYKDANGQDITLKDLVKGLPPNTTLEDLLATVLLKTAYDWETLPLPGFPLQDFSTDGGTVTYTVSVLLNGGGPLVDSTIGVHLPPGARYVTNSTQLSGGPGTADEPTLQSPENELNWHANGLATDTSYELTFQAKPGLSLGTEQATAKIAATGLNGTVNAPDPATTLITEPGEPGNGQPATAPPVQPDKLYLGYTSSGSDRDYFQVHADPGEQLTIHLSHLKVDDDLVIYGPGIIPLRTPHPGAQAPAAGDVPFELGQRTQSITPEALNDVPQDAVGQPALDVSDNRGLADEEVSAVSPEGGTYTIQVASFDGDYSNDPWMLRVERSPAIPLPTNCTNPQGPGTGVTKPMPVVPAAASTLYLFASKRFGDLYGLQAENDVFSRLQTLAARSDAAGGAVIPVDANGPVLTALNARALDSCSTSKANNVVRAIGNLLDNPQVVRPSVKYIVVVGDDAGIPFGRILDNSAYANERGYASTFLGASNNQYLSTYGLGFLPTDDALGDVNYSGQGPYVPELALGRLVETPDQILSQITQYINRNGAINPTRALTTGYDFLSDGATKISADFKAKVGTNNAQELINNSWTKNNLLGAMFPAANPPLLDSINAHYDHFRSLPADENAAQRETILYTTADLAGRSTAGRVIFTMGCHSALPVSDFVLGSPLNADWAQAYAQAGAIIYMGNTGYGLGDTAAVLYSEKLNLLFADRLDGSMTVGQALAFAKQEYASTPTQSGYHLKVIDEATMMGLPMYRIGTGTTPAPPTPAVTTTDSATGLPSAPFSVTPSFTLVNTPIGSYYTSDDSFAENRRPIEPTTKLDITEPGLVPHGALLTALSSTDDPGFDAAFSRVVDDFSAFSPELVGDVSYPTKLQSIASLATPTGTRQRLVLFSGQFRSDGTADAQGIGIQRRFTALSGNVLYTAPDVTDFTPSSFGPVEVTKADTTVGFAVDVTDDVGGAAGVKRVLALYRDASGVWKSTEMSHNNSTRWSGAGPLTGNSVEWFIQAVDRSGNVAVTSNKALLQSVVTPPPTGNIEAHATGPQTNGWFTDTVAVTISGAPDIEYSLDHDTFTPGTSLSVNGTGIHSLDFQGSDSSHGSLPIPIDVSDPTVTVNGTYGFGSVAHATCADAGSGIASCSVPDPLDTSSAGLHTIHAHAEDRAGHTFDSNLTYSVTPYSFTGFFSPINNLPTINDVNAGSAVPIKFGLSGFRNFNLFAPGYPASQAMTSCGGALTGPLVPTQLGPDGFTYDPLLDQYKYVWKTDGNWRGCRQLIVRFKDGTEKRANFRFK